ncbi:MAG TPA: ATP-binding protein, partial [Bdellovibrio sp.]|nr:ATP-binding protein [Bdellovibrio sp.]
YYRSKTSPVKYWYTFCAIVGVSILGVGLESFIGYRSVGFVYLLAVIFIGMFGSIGAVALAATLSAGIWNYFFIPPKFTFQIRNTEDTLMCLAFFVVALITGFLTNRIRFHEMVIREREQRTNVLYGILQEIAAATEKSEFLNKVIDRVGQILNADCGVILRKPEGGLEFDDAKSYSIRLNEKDQAVAQWCFDKTKPAGWSTDTLSEARALFLPLKGSTETVGVFVFQPKRKIRKIDLDKENLLISIVRQLGAALEKHFLMKRLSEAQRLKDSEELHQTLLNSISHEMRTPLTAILGGASALEDESTLNDKTQLKKIADGLHDAGERLNRVIENLLDMSRLNSGVLSLRLEWHDVNDLLGIVLKKLDKALSKHTVKTHFMDEVTLLKIDYRLMEHAVSNVILNASMYSPEGTEIEIFMRKDRSRFYIEVADQGPGIPENSLNHVFEKFYRVPGTPAGGTGLGLSIVKSIVELHKGVVAVQNVQPHGAKFAIILPLEEQPQLPRE